jgi:hypothetical protein
VTGREGTYEGSDRIADRNKGSGLKTAPAVTSVAATKSSFGVIALLD